MEDYLVLFARFGSAFVEQELLPEIEENCRRFGILYPTAYDVFQKNKYAENSLYFHHLYAVADIPIGREYEAIAYRENGKIQTDTIQKCPSKVLCFFTYFETQPSDQAMRGHHELSLIQFEQRIPPLIRELVEITERKPLDLSERKDIYLGSEIELWRLARKEEAAAAAAKLLEKFGIKKEEDYYAQDEQRVSAIYEAIRRLTVEQYALQEEDTQEVLQGGLFELWQKNRAMQDSSKLKKV